MIRSHNEKLHRSEEIRIRHGNLKLYEEYLEGSPFKSSTLKSPFYEVILKVKNEIPVKLISYESRSNETTGLNCFNFYYPINQEHSSRLGVPSKKYTIILFNNNVKFRSKILTSITEIEVEQKTDYLKISTFSEGKKNSIEYFETNEYIYIGELLDNEPSGQGEKIIKSTQEKFIGSFKKSKSHGKILVKKKGFPSKSLYFSRGEQVQQDTEEENKANNSNFNNRLKRDIKGNEVKNLREDSSKALEKEMESSDRRQRNPFIKKKAQEEKFKLARHEDFDWLWSYSSREYLFPVLNDITWADFERIQVMRCIERSENSACLEENKIKHCFENGEIYKGGFKNEKFEGFGVYQYTNGLVYKGEFRAGLREGTGVLLDKKRKVIQGHWLRDFLHGICKCYSEKYIVKAVFKEGKLVSVINIISQTY